MTKDRAAVSSILSKSLPESQRFQKLLEEAKNALRRLPIIVRRAFYYDYNGEPFLPKNESYNQDFSDASDAKRKKYLIDEDNYYNAFKLNKSDQSVSQADNALQELAEFIADVESDSLFHDNFEDENGYGFSDCLSNERFWEEYLYKS